MTLAPTQHIVLDEASVAWISNANVKVVEVVLDGLAYGWSPAEMHFQHPHLSLAQIHAALSYYYDHQSAMNAELKQREIAAEQLRPSDDSPVRQRLRTLGRNL